MNVEVNLIPGWKRVLRRAWSLRLMLVAGLLTGFEAILQVIPPDFLPVPKWALPIVTMLVIGGAFVMRLIAQKGIRDAD